MATSSETFDNLFQRRVDMNYNSYYSPVQRERVYKQALYNAFERIYRSMDVQEEYDELRSFIKTNIALTPVNNEINIDTVIPDYNHYLFARGIFYAPYNPKLNFKEISYNGSQTIVKTNSVLPYRDGDLVRFFNVIAMPEANGQFYVKQIAYKVYQLFTDPELTIPFLANITNIYTSDAGNSQQVLETKFMVQYSDERIQVLDQPTIRNPKVMIAERKLEIYPNGCQSFILDYLTLPPVFITQTNGVFDPNNNLEAFYPFKFIMQILGTAAEIYNTEIKDGSSFGQTVNLENLNP